MQVSLEIGGRHFEIACSEGEEDYLMAAARFLSAEAQYLQERMGHLSESQMLLMAGLMLADKHLIELEERKKREREVGELRRRNSELENRPDPEPERVDVPVIPDSIRDSFAEIAARLETLVDRLEEKETT